MFVYSAAMLSSMNVDESVLGTIKFGSATLKEIWDPVSEFVDDLNKNGSSECMITNLYYSISDFRKRVFREAGGSEYIGKRCYLTAASFIMITDESIFTPDTTSYVG